MATGRKIRILTVVDTFLRFSPVVDPRFSYRGDDVVVTLERTCRLVGAPKTIRVDQSSEFISHDLDLWAYQRGVDPDFSRAGKPADNAFIVSFNGKFRTERPSRRSGRRRYRPRWSHGGTVDDLELVGFQFLGQPYLQPVPALDRECTRPAGPADR